VLLAWVVVECNETMQQFQDTVEPDGNDDDDNANDENYDCFRDDDDQYTSLEINIVTAYLALLEMFSRHIECNSQKLVNVQENKLFL